MEAETTLYNLNKDQVKEVFDNCKAKLKELGLEKLQFSFIRSRSFEKKDIQQDFKQALIVFEGMVPNSFEEKVSELENGLEKFLGPYAKTAFVEVKFGPSKAEETENTKAPTCSTHGCSDDYSNKASSTTIETELQLCKKFEELYESNKNLIEKISGLAVGFMGTTEVSANEEKFSGTVSLDGLISPQDKPGVLEFWKNVIQPLVKDHGFDFSNRLGVKENPEVKCGSACATCKKALGNDVPHYVCTVCQSEGKEDHAFCVECADKECSQDITSAKDLFHPHALLFLHKDSQDALKSLQGILNTTVVISDDHPNYAKIKESKGVSDINCRVCWTSPLPTYRWACANCRDFDLCIDCFKAANDPNNEKHKEAVEEAEKRGHKDFHLFYRAHYLLALQTKPFEVPK